MKLEWVLRVGTGAVLALVTLIVSLLVAARFHDGPFGGGLAIVAAGRFESGQLHSGAGRSRRRPLNRELRRTGATVKEEVVRQI